jgi:hypothetical protein
MTPQTNRRIATQRFAFASTARALAASLVWGGLLTSGCALPSVGLLCAGCSKHSAGEGAAEPSVAVVASATPDAASTPPGERARDYTGTLGTQAIAVHLVQTGHAVTGAYLYARVGRPIAIGGTTDAAGQLVLDEKSEGEMTGRWHLHPVETGLAGDWTNPKGTKTFPVQLSPGDPVTNLLAGVPSGGPTRPTPGAGGGGCHDGMGRAVPCPDDDKVCALDDYVWLRPPGGNCETPPEVGRRIFHRPAPSTVALPPGAIGRCEPGEQGGVHYVCSKGFMYPDLDSGAHVGAALP